MTEAALTLEDALDLVADFDVDLDEEVLEEEAVDGVDAAAFCVEDFDNDDEDLDGDVDLEDDDLEDDKDLDGDPKGNFETDDDGEADICSNGGDLKSVGFPGSALFDDEKVFCEIDLEAKFFLVLSRDETFVTVDLFVP